jgi:putative Holliday junction resolvase
VGRIAAIDFGFKRVGVAISDLARKIAFPVGVVEGGNEAPRNIREALASKVPEVERIIVGLPLLLSGQEGEMAVAVRAFAKTIEQEFKVPVELLDERFSSKIVEQQLRLLQKSRKERTEQIDSAAAAFLLQHYLDRL